jgi:hypothetical protein
MSHVGQKRLSRALIRFLEHRIGDKVMSAIHPSGTASIVFPSQPVKPNRSAIVNAAAICGYLPCTGTVREHHAVVAKMRNEAVIIARRIHPRVIMVRVRMRHHARSLVPSGIIDHERTYRHFAFVFSFSSK